MRGVPTVSVQIPNASYDVTVERGLLSRVGAIVQKLSGAKRCCVVTDEHVGPRHFSVLRGSFPAEFDVVRVNIDSGEENKSLKTVGGVYDQVLAAKIDRRTPILALGG